MSRRLPPLNALRAFEAAARHLSFAKAAAELHVTPAAVSHQIKGLEEQLGVMLFRRLNKAVLLTDAGQRALPGVREAFDRLAETVERVRARRGDDRLTVSVAPSFGAKWLVPRLDRLRAAHPEIDIRIDASMELVDFARDDVDVAIRYGPGRYPGLRVDSLLCCDEVFPVCSPRLRAEAPPLRRPEDLRGCTLLHIDWAAGDEASPDWRMWLRAAGLNDVDATRGPRFSQSSLAIQAAIEGQGVALGERILVDGDLAAGRLVRPFELSVPASFSYYVVSPAATSDRPKVAAFRAWALAEAAREQ